MRNYDVLTTITVEAIDEQDAREGVARLAPVIVDGLTSSVSIERVAITEVKELA